MTEKCEWRHREERRENGVCGKIERERSVETEWRVRGKRN